MANSKYTAPNDFRAFCEALGETETSMCHHGVKGMHWGERKYQDYNGRLTAAGRIHYGYGAKKEAGAEEDASDKALKAISEKYNFNTKYTIRDKVVKDAIAISKTWNENRNYDLHAGEKENKREFIKNEAFENAAIAGAAGLTIGGLTANPLVGLGVSGGSLGANSIISLGRLTGKNIKAHSANKKLENTIKEISENTNVDKATGLKKKNSEMSPDQDMAKVNPGFGNWSDNTKNNCFLCSTTYDLRRKGFDVTANGANDGYDATAALAWYPKASMIRLPSPPNFNKTMQNTMIKAFDTPDGGYGNLSVTWKKTGDGHSMIFAVENGQPVLRDCQTNKVYKGSACNKIFKEANELRYIRLDNVQPNINEMKKWGAINPAGQAFKDLNPAKPTKTQTVSAEKHGDTGFFKNLASSGSISRAAELTKAERRTNKEKKEAFKNTEKAYDGKSRGFDAPLTRNNTYVFDKEVLYNTTYTNKKGRQINVTVATDSSSKETANKGVNSGAKTAKQVADNEASITAQARQKLLSNKRLDFYDISDSDFRSMANKLKISSITTAAKKPGSGLIVLSYDSPKHGKVNVDADFVTLPNGKIIIVGANPNADD